MEPGNHRKLFDKKNPRLQNSLSSERTSKNIVPKAPLNPENSAQKPIIKIVPKAALKKDYSDVNSLKKLKLLTQNKLEKIDKLRSDLMLKTKALIKLIEKEFQESLKKLNQISDTYLDILNKTKFELSDMQIIKKINKLNLKVKLLQIDEIQNLVKVAYGEEFISYEKVVNDDITRFLDGHVGGFSCGSVTRDGKTLVTGGLDSVVRVWDLVKKNQLFTLHGHNSEVKCLTLTEDTKYIISGSQDACIRIWSLQQEAEVNVFKGHETTVFVVYYLEKRHSVVSGDYDGEVIIWDFEGLKIINKLKNPGSLYCLIVTRNLINLITGSNQDIVIFKFSSGHIVSTLKAHDGYVKSLVLTSQENCMVSGSNDQSIIIWDFINLQIIVKLDGHSSNINSIVLSSDDQFIFSGSDDETIIAWSMHTGEQTNMFSHHSKVNCILRVDKKVLSLTENSEIGELDIESWKFQTSRYLNHFNSNCILNKSDSGVIAYGSDKKVAFCDMSAEVEKNVIVGHFCSVTLVEISRDGRFAISCSNENKLIYWNLQTNQKIGELLGHKSSVLCVCFSEDGLTAASGSFEKIIRIWNLREAKQEIELHGSSYSIYSIKFLNKSKFLVSGGGFSSKVIIWNLKNRTQHAVLSCKIGIVNKLLVSEDQKFILSAGLYKGIEIWNANKLKQEFKFMYLKEAESWLKENGIDLYKVRRFLKH